jgi:hypothetical protein
MQYTGGYDEAVRYWGDVNVKYILHYKDKLQQGNTKGENFCHFNDIKSIERIKMKFTDNVPVLIFYY